MVLSIPLLPFHLGWNLVSGATLCIRKAVDADWCSYNHSIIGSLAGTSYWGPVAGHGLLTHDLDLLREERKRTMPIRQGVVQGPIEAVPAGPNADGFTRIHRRDVKSEGQ